MVKVSNHIRIPLQWTSALCSYNERCVVPQNYRRQSYIVSSFLPSIGMNIAVATARCQYIVCEYVNHKEPFCKGRLYLVSIKRKLIFLLHVNNQRQNQNNVGANCASFRWDNTPWVVHQWKQSLRLPYEILTILTIMALYCRRDY